MPPAKVQVGAAPPNDALMACARVHPLSGPATWARTGRPRPGWRRATRQSPPQGPAGILRPVVQAPAGPVPHLRQDLTPCRAVARQRGADLAVARQRLLELRDPVADMPDEQPGGRPIAEVLAANSASFASECRTVTPPASPDPSWSTRHSTPASRTVSPGRRTRPGTGVVSGIAAPKTPRIAPSRSRPFRAVQSRVPSPAMMGASGKARATTSRPATRSACSWDSRIASTGRPVPRAWAATCRASTPARWRSRTATERSPTGR